MKSETLKCMECGIVAMRLFPDPRTPPLSVDPCLCKPCLTQAVELGIEELQDYLDDNDEVIKVSKYEWSDKRRQQT